MDVVGEAVSPLDGHVESRMTTVEAERNQDGAHFRAWWSYKNGRENGRVDRESIQRLVEKFNFPPVALPLIYIVLKDHDSNDREVENLLLEVYERKCQVCTLMHYIHSVAQKQQ